MVNHQRVSNILLQLEGVVPSFVGNIRPFKNVEVRVEGVKKGRSKN